MRILPFKEVVQLGKESKVQENPPQAQVAYLFGEPATSSGSIFVRKAYYNNSGSKMIRRSATMSGRKMFIRMHHNLS